MKTHTYEDPTGAGEHITLTAPDWVHAPAALTFRTGADGDWVTFDRGMTADRTGVTGVTVVTLAGVDEHATGSSIEVNMGDLHVYNLTGRVVAIYNDWVSAVVHQVEKGDEA